MSEFLSELGSLASQNQFLAYFIIYVSTIFLGNFSAFVSFWLMFQGVFGPWGLLFLPLTIFSAVFSGDLLWYSMGKGLHNTRIGYFMRNKFAPQHEKVEKTLGKNARLWILFSKFMYASSFPIVFMAGWINFPLKKLIKSSLLSITIWLPTLTVVAYGLFAGLTPLQAFEKLRKFEGIFLIAVGLFILLEYSLAKIIKRFFAKFLKNGFEENEGGEARYPHT